jgi:hypothetical protein
MGKSISIRDKVNNYPTKHQEGFTGKEIKELLKEYPQVKEEDFFKAMGVHTAMFKDGESITYHCDIELALRCVVERREPKVFEWD